jgi:hypothetical protein
MCEADASRNQLRQCTQAKYTGKTACVDLWIRVLCLHLVRWARTPRAFDVALAQGCISMAEGAQVAKPEKSDRQMDSADRGSNTT